MERRFSLIKSDFEKHEKRILPRFPFCYLTFKSEQSARVLEVKDISLTGMQIRLKEELNWAIDEGISGTIHWLGRALPVQGNVKWVTNNRLGIEFVKKQDQLTKIQNFLSFDEIVKNLKPLHKVESGLELPARLKYWLRSDGPVELFVWQHADGELSKFQILLMENFLEWEDGAGLKTGRILSKRNIDTPLINEEELVFKIDQDIDLTKVGSVKELVGQLPGALLSQEVQHFLMRQLT
ncbi:MAG: PilZ domain-containing protein [Bacteriovoracaceae bacterium]